MNRSRLFSRAVVVCIEKKKKTFAAAAAVGGGLCKHSEKTANRQPVLPRYVLLLLCFFSIPIVKSVVSLATPRVNRIR